jgi:uncharacterized membrane protein YkvA (DUF1232 family)
MKVSFELSESDIRYFRDRLLQARSKGAAQDEDRVIRRAAKLVQKAATANPPEFVIERLGKLDQLTGMLLDEEWRLEGRDRARILNALAYFAEEEDLIPDRVPGLGYLDDAIMVELVMQELKHEIEAYDDFCKLRKTGPNAKSQAKREARRKALQARMRRRLRRDREPHGGSRKPPLRLW